MSRLVFALFRAAAAARGAEAPRNVVVYREPGRFGAWPANKGIRVWGDDLESVERKTIWTGASFSNRQVQAS